MQTSADRLISLPRYGLMAGLALAVFPFGLAVGADQPSGKADAAKPSSPSHVRAVSSSSPSTATAPVRLDLPESVKPGETFLMQVRVNEEIRDLAGTLLIFRYKDGVFVPLDQETEVATPLIKRQPLTAVNFQKEKLMVGIVSPRGVNGPGMLASFSMKVRPDAKPGRYDIRLSTEMNDPDSKTITADAMGGTLLVEDPKAAARAAKRRPISKTALKNEKKMKAAKSGSNR